nr:MAG TPA: hypothetical protein [Caudoviricetes sp.]
MLAHLFQAYRTHRKPPIFELRSCIYQAMLNTHHRLLAYLSLIRQKDIYFQRIFATPYMRLSLSFLTVETGHLPPPQ